MNALRADLSELGAQELAARTAVAELDQTIAASTASVAALTQSAEQAERELAQLRSLQEAEALELARLEATIETTAQAAAISQELREIENIELTSQGFGVRGTLNEEQVTGPNLNEGVNLPRVPGATLAALDPAIKLPKIGETAAPTFKLREEAEVVAALSRAPGLNKLTSADLATLKAELVRGTCIPDALVKVTGTVNRLTLRALLRGMERCRS